MQTPDRTDAASVLVIAYEEKAREVIASCASRFGLGAACCASFAEAEDAALAKPFQGVLVDLASMIKAKDTEKLIAHTLTNIFPTLRVKVMGAMLIPMIMSGDAKQDKSIDDFFRKSCAGFMPRRLRAHKRKEICLPTLIGERRGFTIDLSWSGAFIADPYPEQFQPGQELQVTMLAPPGPLTIPAVVVRLQQWGERRPPGIGIQFRQVDENTQANLQSLLHNDRNSDRDRLAK